ncbi:MAG TPA: expansin EXLX1 family cellulose-binding protein [Kofleriaceae bacterium]|nr:expansin EXLX1 family cellulose-binding protein [Kofleriaceae bacterium]
MKWAALLVSVAACSNTATMDDQPPPGNGDGGLVGGSCSAVPVDESGDGTYYAADGTGNCSFDASPNDLLVAAMNHPDYGSAQWCGACVAVTGPKGSVTVRIVDQCPECLKGSLDMSPQAFDMIADHAAGRVPITWHEVACDVTGPIDYHFKDGANAYWTAIQIRNGRYPISKVEAMKNGSYVEIPRLDYNYFVAASGLGAGPYQLRVTDQRGHVVEDTGIALGDNVTRTGASQFDVCP